MVTTMSADPRIAPPISETPVLQTREYAEASGLKCPKCSNDRFSFGAGAFSTTLQGTADARQLPDSVKAAIPCPTCATMLVVEFSGAKIAEQEQTATFQHQAKLAKVQVRQQEEAEAVRLKGLNPEDALKRKQEIVADLTGQTAPKATAAASAK